MTKTEDRRAHAVVTTVPLTPELSAELYRLCGQLALAKQRSATWLKHGPTGALSTSAFFARWLEYEESEAAVAEEIRRLTYPPVRLALKRRWAGAPGIAA